MTVSATRGLVVREGNHIIITNGGRTYDFYLPKGHTENQVDTWLDHLGGKSWFSRAHHDALLALVESERTQ